MLIFLNEDLIDYENFFLLYDKNTGNNLDLSYEIYDIFDLDLLCDDECKNVFRFYKNGIYKLKQVLRVKKILSVVTDACFLNLSLINVDIRA